MLKKISVVLLASAALAGCDSGEVGDVSLGIFTMKDIKISHLDDDKIPGVTCHIASIAGSADSYQLITARLGEQMFGVPIEQVQDVFMVESLTKVPGALPEIAGILNLREYLLYRKHPLHCSRRQ